MNITTFIIVSVIKTVLALFVLLTAVAYTVWLERKVVGHMQNRWGPTRVGPFGLLQPLADGVKFLFKEDLTPPHVYKPLYIAAPMIAVMFALTSIAVIPVGNCDHDRQPAHSAADHRRQHRPADYSGRHFARRVWRRAGGLVVQQQVFPAGRIAGQRADDQLRNFAGAFSGGRADADRQLQPAGHRGRAERDVLGIIPRWNIFYGGQFIAFFIYLMSAYAETNRIPFDLPEAETELVAGYHTEYSAMKFAMFFMAEYANMITVAAVASLLFLGGWHGPVFGPPILQSLLPVFWFVLRIFGFLFVYIWVRGTLPRFRYDQLMAFGWKFLLPLAIANLVVTALVVALRA